MDALKNKKTLLAALIAVVFAASVILVVVLTISRKPGKEGTTWPVSGATIDNQYTVEGWSEEGFDGDEACLMLKNKGERLPVTVKKAEAGPPDVYEQEDCGDGTQAPGGSGRNGLLALARVVPCATGVVLKPGENCSLGVRLVASGTPNGSLGVTTEVMCASREIAPCQLLKEGLNPSEQKPLALTVEQESQFPKSDSEFQITTKEAELTAVKAEPDDRTPAPGPVPDTGEPTTEPAPDERTETVTPPPETVTPPPVTETEQPGPTDETPYPGGPDDTDEQPGQEPENPQDPDEGPPPPQVPAS
ncbi:hypothetical protein [Actinocorallia populi]|uniref:hypothetical protein n=1 Tax=Actinocorallia populi TaxID=2079200 RepID=UPI000D0911C9|nr:hypothetical protein [Actinocorallia populi]